MMRQDNINMIETLLKQGISDAKELSKKSGLSINRVYEIKKELGYGKKRRTINGSAPVIQQEEKTTPKTETIHNTNKISDEMKRYIPQMNGFNKYIERKLDDGKTDFEIIEALYKMNKPLLLVGDTGCGKTHAVWHFAYKKGLPYERCNFDGSTTPEEFIGKWTPNKNGGFEWVDGLLTKFVRNGGVFVIDELNSGSPDLMFFLHPLLDDEKKIVLLNNGGEVIHAHKNFYLVASLPYDEKVFLENGLSKIGEIVENNFKKHPDKIKAIGNNEIINTNNSTFDLNCYAYNPSTQKNELRKITALIRHKPTDLIYQIDLEFGKKCQVTGSHSVFKEIGEPIQVSKLKKGDSILIPTRIELENKGNGIFDMTTIRNKHQDKPFLINDNKIWWYRSPHKVNKLINLDNPELGWLLGFWIAEGSFCSTITNKSAKLDVVSYSNKKLGLIQKTRRIVKEIFGTESYVVRDKRTKVYTLAIGSKIITYFFRYMGLTTNCYNKRIPDFVFKAKKDFIKEFLKGMCDGDGTKEGDGFSCYSTTSEVLANQTAYLYLSFGQQTSIYQHQKGIFEKRDSKGKRVNYYRKKLYVVYLHKRKTKEPLQKIKIKSIKKLKVKKQYVYDFEVLNDKANDNFIGGTGGVLLHNTMNPDYEGTKPLNQALQDRFEIIEFDYDEKVERKLISSRKLLKFAQRIRDTFRKGEIVTPLSTRGLISYEKNLSLFGKNIARTLLLNKFKTEERQSVGEVFDLVMNDQNEKDDAVKGEEVKE